MADLDRVSKDSFGNTLIRWKKEDGGWHRAAIMSSQNADEVLDAVDRHLKTGLSDFSGVKTRDRSLIIAEKERPIADGNDTKLLSR